MRRRQEYTAVERCWFDWMEPGTTVVAVYRYSTYPRGSVLAGRERREWLDEYATVEEALAAHPEAEIWA